MTAYLLEHAWIDGAVHDLVRVEVEHGRFVAVECDSDRPGVPVRGLTFPGFANTHSHAFHRALRGRTQRQVAGDEPGSFWTWREQMYAAAARLDPDSYFTLARATFAEMVAAGYTSVGEFHYLHHAADGSAYDRAHAMERALVAAARDAGIRLTLLDTLYLSSGFGAAPEGVQRRFADASAHAWRDRVAALREELAGSSGVLVGVAAHSVRAVPAAALEVVAEAAAGGPLHVHLSEQVKENADCLAATGVTPTRLLADSGCLGRMTSAVHATHLTADDIALLGKAGCFASFCPTTERDLGDGIGPSRALQAAGARITLGSDSHAVIDPFEEMRALELDERLATQHRGHWSAAELLLAASAEGQRSLGWADAGQIAVGQRADLVTIDVTTPRTAGTGAGAETAVFAAGAADVRQVMIDGVMAFTGDHSGVGRGLVEAIERIWS